MRPNTRSSSAKAAKSAVDKTVGTVVDDEPEDTDVSDYADSDADSDGDGDDAKHREAMRQQHREAAAAHLKWRHDGSDALTLLNVVTEYVQLIQSTPANAVKHTCWRFCKTNYLRHKVCRVWRCCCN